MGLVAGRYRILRSLGEGAQAQVVEALDEQSGATVALKWAFQPGPRQEREAQLLEHLQLECVPRLLDRGEEGGRPFVVMERVDGLPWPGRFSGGWDQLLGPLRGLLAALVQLHGHGLVHRDLKPTNVRVRPDGSVVLLDLGLARAPDSTTVTQGFVGTPAYAAPEQRTARDVDGRADLHAVGVMVLEALNGQLPERSTQGVRVEGVLGPAARWIRQMVAPHPQDRPFDAGEALAGLDSRPLPWLGPRVFDDVLRRLADGPVVVSGSAGSGRTRLVTEVVSRWEGEVVRAQSGTRPFESLLPLTGPLGEHGPRQLERALASFKGLLVCDVSLDRWSQRVLETSSVRALRTAATGGDVVLRPLCQDDLRQLFLGPDRILHLREDAASEMFRRTGGHPASVARVLLQWRASGQATEEDGRWRVSRQALDLLQREVGPRDLVQAGALPDELSTLAAAVRVAWPNASVPVLSAMLDRPAWELNLALEDLVQRGAVSPDGAPRWHVRAPVDRVRRWRTRLADQLPIGTPGRLEHLLAVGGEGHADEALALARAHEEEGRTGAAIGLLLQAPGCADVHAELARLVIDRGDAVRGRDALAKVEADRGRAPTLILRAWLEWVDRKPEAAERTLAACSGQRGSLEVARQGVRLRLAQARGGEAEFFATLDGVPADKELSWRGLWLYRQGRMAEAAKAHEAAAALRTGSRRLASMLNAASAWMEAGELEPARALARSVREHAALLRHAGHESRALWIERNIASRMGTGASDASIVEAAAVGAPLAGRLLLTESWIALKNDPATAATLAERAATMLIPRVGRLHALATMAAATGSLPVDLATQAEAVGGDLGAELWALMRMADPGLPVPASVVRHAQEYARRGGSVGALQAGRVAELVGGTP